MKKRFKITMVLFLIVSLMAGFIPSNYADAAKKTKIAKKKMTIYVGKTQMVKLKNKKKGRKYSFKAKNSKIVNVSKKGVVKGKKAGKTTVTVKEKYKKKKAVTIGKVTITVKKKTSIKPVTTEKQENKIQQTSAPTSPAETNQPTPTPTIKPAWLPYAWQDYDLSARLNNVGTYNAADKTLELKNVPYVILPLDANLIKGQVLAVEINAEINSEKGFRSYLTDLEETSLSNKYTTASDQDFKQGENNLSYQITAKKEAKYLRIEGLVDNIENMVIKSIRVRYTNEITVVPLFDPYVPLTAQDADTDNLQLTKSFSEVDGKLVNNPLITQSFMADPAAIEANGRLYIYGTADTMVSDIKGRIESNEYKTKQLRCISSADLVNWRDEGVVDVGGVASWANFSWAPTICKNGDYFYLYFANGSGGIGVLRSKSPTGPWEDPLGKALITENTPNCSKTEVPWLFDPAVLVDDDGTGYLYFGGGTGTNPADPKSGRVAKLGKDMISLDGEPQVLEPAYLFEDSEINKINGKYYYSYCANWNVPSSYSKFGQANIAYYTSDQPMTGYDWTAPSKLFDNPGSVFGTYYNNHHKIVQFKNQYYLAYHTVLLEEAAYGNVTHVNNSDASYRTMHLDKVTVGDDGSLSTKATYEGVSSVADLDAFTKTNATTMAWNGGLKTIYSEKEKSMVIDSIQTGDWLGLNAVDFGAEGAASLKMDAASTTNNGKIEIYIDGSSTENGGTKIGEIIISKTTDEDSYSEFKAELEQKVTGNHKLFFVFRGEGYHISNWQFEK